MWSASSIRFGAFLAPYHPLDADPALQLRRDIDLMTHLDHLGFEEAWMGEHHSTGAEIVPAPDMFIAAAAERTERIQFGTGVTSLPYHHPLITADRITQLDLQTRGRLIFGTGPGKIPLDAHMMGINRRTSVVARAKRSRPFSRCFAARSSTWNRLVHVA